MEQTTAVLVAGAIGAGGSIITQLVGGLVGVRAQSKRLAWEKAVNRADRFGANKRELFASYIAAHRKFLEDVDEPDYDDVPGRSAERALRALSDATERDAAEIVLLAPDIAPLVQALRWSALQMTIIVKPSESAASRPTVDEILLHDENLDMCRAAMSAHLYGDPPPRRRRRRFARSS